MAITRAQIVRQLYRYGGGADMGAIGGSANQGPAGGASAGGDYGGNRNPEQSYGGGDRNPGLETNIDRRAAAQANAELERERLERERLERERLERERLEAIEKEKFERAKQITQQQIDTRKQNLRNRLFLDTIDRNKAAKLNRLDQLTTDTTIGGIPLGPFSAIASSFNVPKEVSDFDVDSLREIASTKTTLGGSLSKPDAKDIAGLREDFRTESQVGKGLTQEDFDEYLNKNINQGGGEGGLPAAPMIPLTTSPISSATDQEPEEELSELQRLIAERGTPYRFMAIGGLAANANRLPPPGLEAFQGQNGGGIMPRLDSLGQGVSSAENTLQDLNQALQELGSGVDQAEGTLGSSGNEIPMMPPRPPGIPIGPGGVLGGNEGRPFGTPIGSGVFPRPPTTPPADFTPSQATIDKYGEYGFNNNVLQFLENDAKRATVDGGFDYNYDPNTQMFTGYSMAGQSQGTLDQLQEYLDGGGRGFGIPNTFTFTKRGQYKDGGIMNDDIIGGMADGNFDEMGRQMYGLGKLVKKATRAVKKIVKSPVGVAALGAYGFGLGPFKNIGYGSGFLSNLFKGKTSFIDKLGGKATLGILGASALAGLTTPDEDEDQLTEEELRGPGLDIASIRANPYATKGQAYAFYADGGDVEKEPVAKKVMPLLDMDGKEKDYRETGGFVDIGRMERADDVPARLSKNEFVFTADAVRNAGDGNIDKGAEVMYNMMKNLENGGDVSEESQGLEGARNMFQTSQRLEEVL